MQKANLIIKKCINEEANALASLADTIGEIDIKFLEKIETCKGNVVLSGIGKSLLVGNKIAGTLSSVGVRALSISATDMLHGNIGILRTNDVLIFISNSGETLELIELAKHLDSMGSFTILSITGNSDSTLAKLSEISKEIKTSEAGPFALVPTSSTTAVMAYGDALATALAKMKGLTINTFRTFHPGGKIGALLL